MRAISERTTLLPGLSRPVAFSSFGDFAILAPAFTGCIDERQHGLHQAIGRNTECNEGGCAKDRFGAYGELVLENGACRERGANRTDESNQKGGADRESTRRCGGPASRSVGIHGCVRHPISTCVNENAAGV